MTRKEILLDIAERCGIDIDGSEYVMTYNRDKMIKFKRWLFKELKNADKEPCEDCVSRTQAFSAIRSENVIKALPSVIPTCKKGEWIMNSDFPDEIICSCCNINYDMWFWEQGTMNYCPNCGAEMENEE